ncbi:MAG: trehalose-phosphatase [Hyphomicrobium sp.]
MLQNETHVEERSTLAAKVLAGNPSRYALFLDVDGTLLDIAATPDEVVVPRELAPLLARIAKGLDGALAILTGRQLVEIDVLLEPLRLVGAGVHGAELRAAPSDSIVRVATSLPGSLVDQALELANGMPGIIAEPKGPGLALHYRQAPELKVVLEAQIRLLLSRYADELVLCPGRKLFEIIPAGHSKGTALETLAMLPTFAGRLPVMIGDDVGDVPALAAAQRLGGFGLRVAGEQFAESAADLHGPASVLHWLNRLAGRLEA